MEFSSSWIGPAQSTSESRIRLSYPQSHFSLTSSKSHKSCKFSHVLRSVPGSSVETQKPLLPWLPQYVLPTNSSCRGMHFPPQPNNAASLHIPVLCLNECKIGVPHALSLSLAVSEYCIATEKCPLFTCMPWLQSKEANTVLKTDVGPISVISPLCLCSNSFLSGMGQANKIVNVRQEYARSFLRRGAFSSCMDWHILQQPGCSLLCFLARSFSDL